MPVDPIRSAVHRAVPDDHIPADQGFWTSLGHGRLQDATKLADVEIGRRLPALRLRRMACRSLDRSLEWGGPLWSSSCTRGETAVRRDLDLDTVMSSGSCASLRRTVRTHISMLSLPIFARRTGGTE
jgi:hypothetical protein